MSVGLASLYEPAHGDPVSMVLPVYAKPYVLDQLIPYIGNKRKLLPLICQAISATGARGGTFSMCSRAVG